MPVARGFLGSSIGRKVVMAVTGVILVGFVLGHLFGNLQIYLPNGREAMNAYGEFLRHFLHGLGCGSPRRSCSPRHPAHLGGDLADASRAGRRASVGYRERTWTESDLRLADDALERRDHPRCS
jgi:succinate dehydrogenase / fumarate reductase cytochrome b subunit